MHIVRNFARLSPFYLASPFWSAFHASHKVSAFWRRKLLISASAECQRPSRTRWKELRAGADECEGVRTHLMNWKLQTLFDLPELCIVAVKIIIIGIEETQLVKSPESDRQLASSPSTSADLISCTCATENPHWPGGWLAIR